MLCACVVGAVVQFTYGDDGLNPATMEGDDRPVDFARLMRHTQGRAGGARRTEGTLGNS